VTRHLPTFAAFEQCVAHSADSFVLVSTAACAPCATLASALAHLGPMHSGAVHSPAVSKFVIIHGAPDTRAFKRRVPLKSLPAVLRVGGGRIEIVTSSLDLSDVYAARQSLRVLLSA